MSKQEIKIQCTSDKYMTFSEMIPFEDNPRELTDSGFKKLKKSLLEIGVFKPFLVWKQGSRILGGNQRFAVIHKLAEEGYIVPPLPVTVLDVPEGTARLIVLRDNQSEGDWAYEQLSEYLEKLKEFGVDSDLSGFTDREYEDLQKLSQTPEQLRASLEKMAGEDNIEEMMTKKFGIAFKVPEDDWEFFQSVMKQVKAETGTDEVWPNFKYMMGKLYPSDHYSGLEPAPEEDDGFDHDVDLEADEAPPLEDVKPKKSKTKKAKREEFAEAEFPV